MAHFKISDSFFKGKIQKFFQFAEIETKTFAVFINAYQLNGFSLPTHLRIKRRRKQRDVQHIHPVPDRFRQITAKNGIKFFRKRFAIIPLAKAIVMKPIRINQIGRGQQRVDNRQRIHRGKGKTITVGHSNTDRVFPRGQGFASAVYRHPERLPLLRTKPYAVFVNRH